VLVHELIDLSFCENFFGLPPALPSHLKESHTDVPVLGPLVERTEFETLVLTHLVPADPKLISDAQWRKKVKKDYGGRVIVGDDLLQVPVRRRRPRGIASRVRPAGAPPHHPRSGQKTNPTGGRPVVPR
jgi:hypothetical protein